MHPIHRSATAGLLLAGLVSLAAPLLAADHVNVSAGLTHAGAPLAIHGYDPVAFFTEKKAVLGKEEHTVAYDGGAFRFASAANKKAFAEHPERYAPQYGGFCAYGAALGAKFDGDPRLFAVVGGKLYFNLDPDIQKKWSEDVAGNIKKADANWPSIRDKDSRDLK